MRPANRNLLLQGVPALLVTGAGALFFREGQRAFQAAQNAMPESPGSVGDVEGYAFLLDFVGSGAGQLAALALQVVGFLVLLYGCLLLLLSLLARGVYKGEPGRILAYRVLVGVDLVLMVLPVPWLAAAFVESLLDLRPRSELAMFALLLALPAVFVIRTTYTGRITAAAPPSSGR